MKEDRITCLECNGVFIPKRVDAKFCCVSCKNKYNYKMKNIAIKKESEHQAYLKNKEDIIERDKELAKIIVSSFVEPIQAQIDQLKNEKNSLAEKVSQARCFIQEYNEEQALLDKKQQRLKYLDFWMKASDELVFNYYLSQHKEILKQESYPQQHVLYTRLSSALVQKNAYLNANIKRIRILMADNHRLCVDQVEKLDNSLNYKLIRFSSSKKVLNTYLSENFKIGNQINQLNKQMTELFDLEKYGKITQEIKVQNQVVLRTEEVENKIPKVVKDEMSFEAIMNLKSESFCLKGDLGKFLGQLERQSCAVTLIGDSGAGKSYFSYDLAELFDQNGYLVYYFSLEEGVGELTKKKLQGKSFSNSFKITGSGKLAEVRKVAKQYDVVIIDSFGKIDAKAEDYDKLRMDFPNTIFICIFQKTTQGSVRGGSAIVFDSSAIIDVQKRGDDRVAVMQKSRYGTANWEYSLLDKCLIKESN